jgi:integrase
MEKVGPKSLARTLYQQRKVAVKTDRFCLMHAREAQRRAQEGVFSAVVVRYLAWSHEQRPRSIGFRKTALKHLCGYFGDTPLQDITRTDVERYQRTRQRADLTPATINRERSVLSHLFTMAQRWGLVEPHPVRGTARYAEENESPRPISPEEEARLFAALPAHYHPIITLALRTGLRLGELRAQLWRDVDLTTGTLRVTRPKSKRIEVLPLNATTFALLAALPQKGATLFPDMPSKMSDNFIKHAKKAGRTDVTFHCLRDTFISRLTPHCTTPTLMALARRRDYRTTWRYVQVDGEHLRQTVERIATETVTPNGTVTRTVTDPSPSL